MPVNGGSAGLEFTPLKAIDKGDFCNTWRFCLENHWRTHVDGPNHYSECSPAGTHLREYYNEKPSWDLSDPVTVDSENNLNLIFTLEKAEDSKGDVNDDSSVDLNDAILALQVMAWIEPSVTVYKEADVNGDGKIGMEEVIYILQKVSGLRQ